MTMGNESATASVEPGLLITRTFDAPRALVFQAWTEPERLAQWWGPKGFPMTSCTVDLRPGGTFHYCLQSAAGNEMWGKFVYREIVEPERIVFVTSFSDAEGNITRHPLSPEWPLEILNTLTLVEHDGKTTLTLQGAPVSATESEMATFSANHDNVRKGFEGTWKQLEEYLAHA